MDAWWIFLLFIARIVSGQSGSELANNGGIWRVGTSTKYIGRIKYEDGEVLIVQSQEKQTDFFFTSFPFLHSEKTQCLKNVFSDRIELALQIEFYTLKLIQAVKGYLYKYQSSLCGNTTSLFKCDVSLLSMHSIRLVQKSSRSNTTDIKYTLEENWQSASLVLQSIEFNLYVSNLTVCQQFRRALMEKCRAPDFELKYSLHRQQTVQRQLEVHTEHVTSTTMYSRIRDQFPLARIVILTKNDSKELFSESVDRITMPLYTQEGFESLQDRTTIDKHLEQQLSTQEVRLEMSSDRLWKNLYWTPELTRPDRLAQVLNSIIHRDTDDSERFIYNRQPAKQAMEINPIHYTFAEVDPFDSDQQSTDDLDSLKDQAGGVRLTYDDKRCLQQFDKRFESDSQSSLSLNATNTDEDTNEQHGLSRGEVERFLRESYGNMYVDDEIIKPRSINARLVKIGRLCPNRNLFSKSVLVRMRPDTYTLSVRCKSEESNNDEKPKLWLTDRIDRVEGRLLELSNQIQYMKQRVEIEQNNNLYNKLNSNDSERFERRKEQFRTSQCSRCSGTARPTGMPGRPWPSGGKGDRGRDGVSGTPGDRGPAGDPGSYRDYGLSGSAGAKGDQGLRGPPGPSGSQGRAGSSGPKGDRGLPGNNGLPGSTGRKGDQGPPGFPASSGPKGDRGPSGNTGLPGQPGRKGDTGFPGMAGTKGDRGSPGISGPPGVCSPSCNKSPGHSERPRPHNYHGMPA